MFTGAWEFVFSLSKGSAAMEFASFEDFFLHLVSSAIRRCRCSEQLCRLSVLLLCAPASHLPLTRISISDTGLGCCLEEFQDLKCGEGVLAGQWDGTVSVKTTNICDNEIRCYQLNLKESVSIRKPIWLPSTVKQGVTFSGTEVRLSVYDSVDVLLAVITCFFQKMLVLKIPNIAMEVVVKHEGLPGSQSDAIFLESLSSSFSLTASAELDHLTLGLEEYVLRHGSSSICVSCFPNRDNLKSGSGMVCGEKHKTTTLAVEAAIVMSEISNPTNNCSRSHGTETMVFCFKDFVPCLISEAFLKALTGIDWKSYGLTLERAVNKKNHALLYWENMPPSFDIHIAVHYYHKPFPKVMLMVQKAQFDKKHTRKAVKLALDDLKSKHAGFLLSAHAHKISRYAPDLAKTIASLVLSSSDSDFRGECLTILGLQPQQSESETVEENIREKIVSVIQTDDRRPQRTKIAPFLFEDDCPHLQLEDDEYDYNEYGFGPMDQISEYLSTTTAKPSRTNRLILCRTC